jgi:hypothetical protein
MDNDIRTNILDQLRINNNMCHTQHFVTITSDEYFSYKNDLDKKALLDEITILRHQLDQKQKRIIEDSKEISRLMKCLQNVKDNSNTPINNGWLSSTWIKPMFVSIPDYWDPDYLCINCYLCKTPLSLGIHHCRKCGHGFCDKCSAGRQPVPERGYLDNQRVCNLCYSEANRHDLLIQ